MKKSILVMLVFAAAILISFAFVTADEPTYKNLKILKKNISKKELDSVMHFFSVSLGEKCTFCHVRNEAAKSSFDFASDANPNKGVARYMMRMTNKINKKYFKDQENSTQAIQTITCYTCHHGGAMPLNKAPLIRKDSLAAPRGDMKRDSIKTQQ